MSKYVELNAVLDLIAKWDDRFYALETVKNITDAISKEICEKIRPVELVPKTDKNSITVYVDWNSEEFDEIRQSIEDLKAERDAAVSALAENGRCKDCMHHKTDCTQTWQIECGVYFGFKATDPNSKLKGIEGLNHWKWKGVKNGDD